MFKFKLDENLPVGLANDLTMAGYNATTVFSEGLSGTPDDRLLAQCDAEGRILITLDLDFSDLRAYPPDKHTGIVVLRPPDQSVPALRKLFSKLVALLEVESPSHRLWIVDEKRLRVRGEA
ncbi:MAG TPA: DUF5615 family PIN-like protein [Symbiobacteriaceae bacterium]|jgi:predicted nuclease of predicted toxin-antitoxin system